MAGQSPKKVEKGGIEDEMRSTQRREDYKIKKPAFYAVKPLRQGLLVVIKGIIYNGQLQGVLISGSDFIFPSKDSNIQLKICLVQP